MKSTKGMNIALWVAQGLLAVAFILSGFMKITSPVEELAANGMTFVHHFSEGMVRFIGICEVLGGLGLILPSLGRIKPILTPTAAFGLATVMVLAIIYHLSVSEPIVPNVILLAIAAFIAWGRIKKAPIQSR